jgi:Tol biopolymer transport system component
LAPPSAFSLSADGRQAAIAIEGGQRGVWIVDLERGSKRLLDPEGASPIYSRDGSHVTYASNRGTGADTFVRKRTDGTGDEELLFTQFPGWSVPMDWSPDGRSLLFMTYSRGGDADIWIHSEGKSSPLLASPFNEWSAAFSPDGRYIAYDVDEGGDPTVYLQPFPGPGPRTAVSIGEGGSPRWARDGRQLYYWGEGTRMTAVAVETAPVLRVGQPRVLFDVYPGPYPSGYDVTADGRFVMMRARQTVEGPLVLRVILNWLEELERLAPHPPR